MRVIITEGNASDEIEIATMELDEVAAEEAMFQYLSYSRSAISFNYPATAETGENVSNMSSTISHGPSNLSAVMNGDQIQVSVQSWYQNIANGNAQADFTSIITSMIANVMTQGIGVVSEGVLSVFNAENTATTGPLFDFLSNALTNADYTSPQGYLVYIYFDENLEPVAGFGEAIQVTSPDELEELQSQLINIPGDGFFYTYLTNFSDNVVTFDNLTIRHKQGVLRAIKEYYPYGLEWGRYDGNRMYNQGLANTPLQEREWGVLGLDQNYFSARFYDPTIGRWHAVDPLEQFHSPYIAMCNDPANNIDPDGRAGVHLIEKEDVAFMAFAIGSSALIYSSMANISSASFASLRNLFSIGGPLQTVVSNTKLFILSFTASVRNVFDAIQGNSYGRKNFGDLNSSDSYERVGNRIESNMALYKGGNYGYIGLVNANTDLGNASANTNTRYFSTNGSFINFDIGSSIEAWYKGLNGGKPPFRAPSDGNLYQTLFFRVEFSDSGNSPWGYAIDHVRVLSVASRVATPLAVSLPSLKPTSPTVPILRNRAPRFAWMMTGTLDPAYLQRSANSVIATANRGNWDVNIYGGTGPNALTTANSMRTALLSRGFADDRIRIITTPPVGNAGATIPSFSWN